MNEPVLLRHLENGVMTLTLNRPAARNALSLDLVRALRDAFQELGEDPEVCCVVMTGTAPAFCSGLDLKDFSAPESPRAEVTALITSIPYFTKPIIAAVNGPAMTGGLELMLACDFALASKLARFGDTHLKISALSGSGMSSRLPQAVGVRWAKQMVFGCQPVDAVTALRIGLVNEVLSADELMPRALSLAAAISSWDPELVAIAKKAMSMGAEVTLTEALRIEKEALIARKVKSRMTWNTKAAPP